MSGAGQAGPEPHAAEGGATPSDSTVGTAAVTRPVWDGAGAGAGVLRWSFALPPTAGASVLAEPAAVLQAGDAAVVDPVVDPARWASERVARAVAASVWETLPYGRGELRALVDSVDRMSAGFTAVRAWAAAVPAAPSTSDGGSAGGGAA